MMKEHYFLRKKYIEDIHNEVDIYLKNVDWRGISLYDIEIITFEVKEWAVDYYDLCLYDKTKIPFVNTLDKYIPKRIQMILDRKFE